jgi:hypothetical protein
MTAPKRSTSSPLVSRSPGKTFEVLMLIRAWFVWSPPTRFVPRASEIINQLFPG